MTTPPDAAARTPRRQLTLLDSTSIIVGIIIGAGIYETTPLIAASVSGPVMLIAVWLFGGLVALLGAISYAELVTAYPREGGDYLFLSRAYGYRMGVMFAWAEFWIIRPGSVGAMAFVFVRYAEQLLPGELSRAAELWCASLPVLLLTALNVLGVRSGAWTQNLLTAVKVIGLLGIFLVALLWLEPAAPIAAERAEVARPDFNLAMILVLFTYGGWNDVSYVAAELHDPRRNVLRALLLGTGTVTLVYVLVNWAMLRGLGFEGLVESEAVAAELLALGFGTAGAKLISLLICISCLGAINGMLFTGARIYYALGVSHPLFRWLGRWNPTLGTPARALVLQAVATTALVVGFGMYEESFSRLVLFAAPFFWFFFLLVGVSLFVLRLREPQVERPYRVNGYPLTPLLFCLSSAFMLYSTTAHTLRLQWAEGFYLEGTWAAAVLVSGAAVCAVRKR